MNQKIIHPNYCVDRGVAEFDVAILELGERVTFTSYIHPICLPSPQELPVLDISNFPMNT